MVSLWGFMLLVALLAAQRLWELRRSRRNELRMREKGGFERFPEHFDFWSPYMFRGLQQCWQRSGTLGQHHHYGW